MNNQPLKKYGKPDLDKLDVFITEDKDGYQDLWEYFYTWDGVREYGTVGKDAEWKTEDILERFEAFRPLVDTDGTTLLTIDEIGALYHEILMFVKSLWDIHPVTFDYVHNNIERILSKHKPKFDSDK